MQSLCKPACAEHFSQGVFSNLVHIMKNEGVFRPVRGISATVWGSGPAHAMYFSSYEYLKEKFSSAGNKNYNHYGHAAAGCVSTLLHDAVMTPADVVKQRMQMCNSPYKQALTATKDIYRREGMRAFYRAYPVQLTMNVPFHSTHFTVYEACQNFSNPDRRYLPMAHCFSGAVAGAAAAAITTPLDVCKTLLNTQEAGVLQELHQPRIEGMGNAFRMVYQLGGISGYFQGMRARVVYQMPSTAIAWSVYEFFKHSLYKSSLTGPPPVEATRIGWDPIPASNEPPEDEDHPVGSSQKLKAKISSKGEAIVLVDRPNVTSV
jgi:solute carrier family 25 iron transporter 28/37